MEESINPWHDAIVNTEVFVPSRSRWERSLTLEALTDTPVSRWKRIYLVVPQEQVPQYRKLARKHAVGLLGCNVRGIALTRQFIGEIAEGNFIMMDDDLRFYTRYAEGSAGLSRLNSTPEDVRLHKFSDTDMFNMLWLVARLLHERTYAHVAISAREGNNRLAVPWVENSRPLRVLAYRKEPFLNCVHNRVAIMEDFDVTLQLLRQGYKNCVITAYAQDQPGTQTSGGCSDYRTHKLHEANVKKLAALHPEFVRTRLKENKTGGDFGTRLEATIYWSKAYQSALDIL